MKTHLLLGMALTCGALFPLNAMTDVNASIYAVQATAAVWQSRQVDDINRFVKQKYPGCSILNKDYDDGRLEVKISHRGTDKILIFDADRHWMRTVWEVRREQLPKVIVRALAGIGFAYSHLDDNDNMAVDTPMGRFYAVQVDTDRRDGIYVVSDKGRIACRYTSDGWNDGRLRGEDRDWEHRWEGTWDEREWDDGEDHFDEGDDEWDHQRKHKRRPHRDEEEDEDEDDGEDHFDEGDDEWDLLHPHREA